MLNKILSERTLNQILLDIDGCPVGNGHKYRDLVAETLSKCLGDVVDVPLSLCEFPVSGGRGDIQLPLKIEVLQGRPLWQHWAHRYGIRSIIVESKNEKTQASVEDVSQLAGYLDQSGLGRFGILVARMGFSKNAVANLSAMARRGERLIIPIAHDQFRELGKASKKGMTATMEYLRRQETLLLQAA